MAEERTATLLTPSKRQLQAAKAILMGKFGINEPTAHAFIRSVAMHGRRKMIDVASQIIAELGS